MRVCRSATPTVNEGVVVGGVMGVCAGVDADAVADADCVADVWCPKSDV